MSRRPQASLTKLSFMGVNKFKCLFTLLAVYGMLLGTSIMPAFANSEPDTSQSPGTPAPGSEGDTLTREDARMALLVYKLLQPDGKLKGANPDRGKKLFNQNCKSCHGEEGHRLNFAHDYRKPPIFIGDRARNDMPTFWYQMNFGDDDRNMEPYIDELTLDELIDIAGYAQTLP